MKKLILQSVLSLLLFAGAWYGLSQVNWIQWFQVEKVSNSTEEKIGDALWESLKKQETLVQSGILTEAVDSIVDRICAENYIHRENIKVHIIEKDIVNAMAIPGGHLVLFTGLIKESKSPEELSGVISHEIAHQELNHVMKKLVKEFGLAALVSMTTGSGGDMISQTVSSLASLVYDRSIEKDADLKAVEYLINAEIDPTAFADFLYKQARPETEASEYLRWFSTHPGSEERAEYLVEKIGRRSYEVKPLLSEKTWEEVNIYFK